MFGIHFFFVLIWEWLTCMPTLPPLPQISHFLDISVHLLWQLYLLSSIEITCTIVAERSIECKKNFFFLQEKQRCTSIFCDHGAMCDIINFKRFM